jgi:hypothetical protein
LDGGALVADPVVSCGEVNDVTGFSAAKAVIPSVQLQTGVVILMEGAQRHSGSVHSQSIVFGSLSGRDGCLDLFVHIHFLPPKI